MVVFVEHPHPELTPAGGRRRGRGARPTAAAGSAAQVRFEAVAAVRPPLRARPGRRPRGGHPPARPGDRPRLRTRLVDLLWLGAAGGGDRGRHHGAGGGGDRRRRGGPARRRRGAGGGGATAAARRPERRRVAGEAGRRWAAERTWSRVAAPLLDFRPRRRGATRTGTASPSSRPGRGGAARSRSDRLRPAAAPTPGGTVKASAIVVTHTGGERARRQPRLACALRQRRGDVEVMLVDNGSADRCGASPARLLVWRAVIRSEPNLGFAGGVDAGRRGRPRRRAAAAQRRRGGRADGWLEAHLETLGRHPEAAASAGRLVSWDGRRHDFVRGGRDLRRPRLPARPGLAGGRARVRRGRASPCPSPAAATWRSGAPTGSAPAASTRTLRLLRGRRPRLAAVGACGRQVVAAPDAVARHRGAATSAAPRQLPSRGPVRAQRAARVSSPAPTPSTAQLSARLSWPPSSTGWWRSASSGRSWPTWSPTRSGPTVPAAPTRAERWRAAAPARRGRWARRATSSAGCCSGRGAGRPALDDGLLLMQLRAAHGFFAGLEGDRAAASGPGGAPDRA